MGFTRSHGRGFCSLSPPRCRRKTTSGAALPATSGPAEELVVDRKKVGLASAHTLRTSVPSSPSSSSATTTARHKEGCTRRTKRLSRICCLKSPINTMPSLRCAVGACSMLALLALVTGAAAAATPPPQYFNLTAISASNGRSVLECWQLSTPVSQSSDAGTAGAKVEQLGPVQSASYSVIPPGFDGGKHNAPAVQYVHFVSGLAHVTLPDSKDEAWVQGGANGLIIAADIAGTSAQGHITTYPSKDTTTLLQIQTKDGVIPPHKVLHAGACRSCEVTLAELHPHYCDQKHYRANM